MTDSRDDPDVLSTILRHLRLGAAVTHLGRFCGAWALDTSGTGRATFHLLLAGRAWVHLGEATPPFALEPGDLLLFPKDHSHLVSNDEKPSGVANAVQPVPLSEPWTGEGAALVCGQVLIERGLAAPLLAALPDFLVFRGTAETPGGWPQTLAQRALEEATAGSVGASIVIERVVDLLFIEAVRQHLRRAPDQSGLFAALADPKLARALSRIHGEIETPWTLEALAEVAGMSRSAFADAFKATLGDTPMKYLTRWRLHLAATWLREGNDTVLDVALRAGYQTEAAFVRAFKREFGTTPGATRVRRRVAPAANGQVTWATHRSGDPS